MKHSLKKILKNIILASLLFSVVFMSSQSSSIIAEAKTLAEIQKEIEKTKEDLEKIGEKEKDLQKEINRVEVEIKKTEDLIKETDQRIADFESKIEGFEVQIEDLNSKTTIVLKQVQKTSKAGSSPIIALISSDNLGEMISSVYSLGGIQNQITDLKKEKEATQKALEDAKNQQLEAKVALEEAKVLAWAQKEGLENVLKETQGKQSEYEKLLAKRIAEKGAAKPAPGIIGGGVGVSPAPVDPTPPPSNPGNYIFPTSTVGTTTSRCGASHGYQACDFPNRTSIPNIWASKGGTIIKANANCGNISVGCNTGYGNFVKIDHGGGVQTLYAHLSAVYVSEGQSVSQGQAIGRMGCSGSSFGTTNPTLGCGGTHLHFEVQVNGLKRSPRSYLNYMPPCESANCN